MAANDYTKRTSKEIDFGDGNNLRDSLDDGNITEQELATGQDSMSEVPTDAAMEQLDADSILQKYKSDIDRFSSSKIILTLSLIMLVLSVMMASIAQDISVKYYTYSLIGIAVSVVGLIYSNPARKETDIINNIVADFKIIERYSVMSSEMDVPPIYKRLLSFKHRPAESCNYNGLQRTAIRMGDSVVYSAQTFAYYIGGTGKYAKVHNLYDCECHDYKMPNPYADGVLVCKGSMPNVIKPNLYVDGKYRFYYINEEKNDSDLEHVTRLMDRLSEQLNDKDFALFYDSGELHLIVKDPNGGGGGLTMESAKETVINTVNLFLQRIQIAKILSEQN